MVDRARFELASADAMRGRVRRVPLTPPALLYAVSRLSAWRANN